LPAERSAACDLTESARMTANSKYPVLRFMQTSAAKFSSRSRQGRRFSLSILTSRAAGSNV
jgi:hypothetical protein